MFIFFVVYLTDFLLLAYCYNRINFHTFKV